MSRVSSCMGGWCQIRERCTNYHAGREDQEPRERLCIPGQDGESDTARVVFHRTAGQWERSPVAISAAAPASWCGV